MIEVVWFLVTTVLCIVNLSMKELTEFIQSNPDSRELKRALAVQMVLQAYPYFAIRDVLQVSVGFISKWKQVFEEQGLTGLMLKHQGSVGYLDAKQRQAVLNWLKEKNYWNLSELQQHIEDLYEVVFASNQSYYELFADAGISWKKTQKRNPKADPEVVEKKTGNHDVAEKTSPGDRYG
jgi:transposase